MIRNDHSAAEIVPTAVLLGSFTPDASDRLHDLIRSARTDNPEALLEIRDRVRSTIAGLWPEITDATMVPVPRHTPGPAHGLVQATCEAIATARGWRVARHALQRTRPAPEGKSGGNRDVEAEATTLTWDGSTSGPVIVLVDDVVRTGATLQACARALRADGDERPVRAIVLAQAGLPRHS